MLKTELPIITVVLNYTKNQIIWVTNLKGIGNISGKFRQIALNLFICKGSPY
jgi:hypothetical protein